MVTVRAMLIAIGIGGNLPQPGSTVGETIARSLADIAAEIGQLRAVSRFFRSPAFPPGSGPDFVNACALAATRLAPREILDGLHRIEARHGRRRDRRWGARTLDLDLLWADDIVAPDPQTQGRWMALAPELQAREAPGTLILPHPRLTERAFVLVPLAEIAPRWRHPVTGEEVAALLAALPAAEKAAICPL